MIRKIHLLSIVFFAYLTSANSLAGNLVNICDRGYIGKVIAEKVNSRCNAVSVKAMAQITHLSFDQTYDVIQVDRKSFSGLSSLEWLKFHQTNLNILPSGFQGLNKLKTLYIQNGGQVTISQAALNNLTNLIEFNFMTTQDVTFKSNAFNKMAKLKKVSIHTGSDWYTSEDYKFTIEKNAFKGTALEEFIIFSGKLTVKDGGFNGVKLKSLNFERNSMMRFPKHILDGQPDLEAFSFSFQRVKEIPAEAFKNTPKLTSLNLEANDLNTFGPGILDDLSELEFLSLQYNRKLTSIADNTFKDNQNLKSFWASETSLISINRRVLKIPQETEISAYNIQVIDEDPTHRFVNLCHLGDLVDQFIELYESSGCDRVSLDRILDTTELKIEMKELDVLKVGSFDYFENLEELNLSYYTYSMIDLEKNALRNLPNLKKLTFDLLLSPITISRSDLGLGQQVYIEPSDGLTIID